VIAIADHAQRPRRSRRRRACPAEFADAHHTTERKAAQLSETVSKLPLIKGDQPTCSALEDIGLMSARRSKVDPRRLSLAEICADHLTLADAHAALAGRPTLDPDWRPGDPARARRARTCARSACAHAPPPQAHMRSRWERICRTPCASSSDPEAKDSPCR
jgi:hypothetical protein